MAERDWFAYILKRFYGWVKPNSTVKFIITVQASSNYRLRVKEYRKKIKFYSVNIRTGKYEWIGN